MSFRRASDRESRCPIPPVTKRRNFHLAGVFELACRGKNAPDRYGSGGIEAQQVTVDPHSRYG
jgi:hypothetical protein